MSLARVSRLDTSTFLNLTFFSHFDSSQNTSFETPSIDSSRSLLATLRTTTQWHRRDGVCASLSSSAGMWRRTAFFAALPLAQLSPHISLQRRDKRSLGVLHGSIECPARACGADDRVPNARHMHARAPTVPLEKYGFHPRHYPMRIYSTGSTLCTASLKPQVNSTIKHDPTFDLPYDSGTGPPTDDPPSSSPPDWTTSQLQYILTPLKNSAVSCLPAFHLVYCSPFGATVFHLLYSVKSFFFFPFILSFLGAVFFFCIFLAGF